MIRKHVRFVEQVLFLMICNKRLTRGCGLPLGSLKSLLNILKLLLCSYTCLLPNHLLRSWFVYIHENPGNYSNEKRKKEERILAVQLRVVIFLQATLFLEWVLTVLASPFSFLNEDYGSVYMIMVWLSYGIDVRGLVNESYFLGCLWFGRNKWHSPVGEKCWMDLHLCCVRVKQTIHQLETQLH